jgi:glycosyltransferase involved in cell wall biosynthesis
MQVSHSPRVSVLMPAYRPDLRYLREAIESIRAQTFADWELVVVEDGGPSGATELVRALGDVRIHHQVRASKTNLADALNDGLALCRAPLVARMDSDDIAAPDRLARQIEFLDANPSVAVVGSGMAVIDGAGRPLGHRRLPTSHGEVTAALRRYNCVAHPAVMFRKDVVTGAGGYRRGLAEDYDLWCRLVGRGARIENLPDTLLTYRFHEEALKFTTVRAAIRATIDTKLRYFSGHLTVRDRMRIAGERMLLLVPPRLVVFLFRLMTYRGTP